MANSVSKKIGNGWVEAGEVKGPKVGRSEN